MSERYLAPPHAAAFPHDRHDPPTPSSSPRVCAACARRSELIARLAPSIAARRPRRWELLHLLSLPNDRLERTLARPADPADSPHRSHPRRPPHSARPRRTAHPAPRVRAICAHHPLYPQPLAFLPAHPAVLYAAARDANPLHRLQTAVAAPRVAIVGEQECTPAARHTAERLAATLAAAGVRVVGGLSVGVEAAAQRGALRAGNPGLALLPAAPHIPYPLWERSLHAQLLRRSVVLAELPPWVARPLPWCFLARNRLLAALADAVIVVEARERAGSLFTAELACALGREVGAVPSHPSEWAARGGNALLRDGAHPILDARDALALLPIGALRDSDDRLLGRSSRG